MVESFADLQVLLMQLEPEDAEMRPDLSCWVDGDVFHARISYYDRAEHWRSFESSADTIPEAIDSVFASYASRRSRTIKGLLPPHHIPKKRRVVQPFQSKLKRVK